MGMFVHIGKWLSYMPHKSLMDAPHCIGTAPTQGTILSTLIQRSRSSWRSFGHLKKPHLQANKSPWSISKVQVQHTPHINTLALRTHACAVIKRRWQQFLFRTRPGRQVNVRSADTSPTAKVIQRQQHDSHTYTSWWYKFPCRYPPVLLLRPLFRWMWTCRRSRTCVCDGVFAAARRAI